MLVDTAPIIYVLEDRRELSHRFRPLFDRQASGELRFAVTTITIAEVLTGAAAARDEALVRRYRSVFESWQLVDLTIEIAETAARLRASLGIKLPDAIQAASALAIGADALVTHDRDFAKLSAPRILA